MSDDTHYQLTDMGWEAANEIAAEAQKLDWEGRVRLIDEVTLHLMKGSMLEGDFKNLPQRAAILIASVLIRLGPATIETEPQAILHICAANEELIAKGIAWLEANTGARVINLKTLDDEGYFGLSLLSEMMGDEMELDN